MSAKSPTQHEWVSALIRFGEMSKEQAVALGSKLACLPSPSNDASIYLTNEFLKKYVGIQSPAERSRIMLAASRCPPPIDHGEDLSIDERVVPELTSTRAALRASLKEDPVAASTPPPSQTEETAAHASREEAAFVSTTPETLVFRKLRNGNARFYDVAGGYATVNELADVEKTKQSEYFKACCAVYDAISSHRVRADASNTDRSASVHPSGVDAGNTDGDYLVGAGPKVFSEKAVKALTPAVETVTVDNKSDMYEPLFANSLVKAALVSRRAGVADMVSGSAETVAIQAESSVSSPTKGPKLSDLVSSIVLLVPSGCILDLLEVKPRALVDMFFGAPHIAGFETEFGGDARFLTRWVLLANKETLTFAIVHKEDTVGLANLRDRWAKAHADTHARENEPQNEAVDEEEEAQEVQDVFAEHMVDMYGTFLNEYELALDDCETVLDNIESNVVEKRGGKEMSAALHHLSRRAAAFERALELASRTLADASDFFDVSKPCGAAELRCARLMERATSIQDRSIASLNLVVSLSGYHTSDAFNVLTRISGALIPLGVCTGAYGMNWEVFPELKNHYSYFIFVVGIISIFVIMIMYLKAKGL